MNRDAFANGRELLIKLQSKLKYPPKRKHIKHYVKLLVRRSGLRHDVRRRYFELLASCALLGKEPMYQFKHRRKRKHGHKEASKENHKGSKASKENGRKDVQANKKGRKSKR